jgi:predicted molibdopterin-dependent oxidoreductase YjgC
MNLTINNQPVRTERAVTILDAALQNDIYIPSLCAHPELTPYGGCRLCIIEIEGRKGYPTACTTLVEDGMNVRTETQVLQEMRRDILQLILSEHPSACLICGDVEGCAGFQETIRKVGVTTGCRWCPKDKDCELQKIVDYLDVKELTLPGLYRDLPIEKYDPFFDRDYNLCIYCGRCVRICNEYRRSSVLSLRQRGKLTTIGPAYEQTHIDADCEFCGACVSVCPTGAMSEKSRKWWGVPEKYEPSVCPLCSINCDVQVLTLKDKIVGTIPPGKPHESGGELCVKGRFCLSELVNRTERILEPEYLYPEGYGIVDWNFAIEKVKSIIRDIQPGRSALFLSPGLTLEEIHAARFFAENILKTDMVSSSCMDHNHIAFMQLARQSVSLHELKSAGLIMSFFQNGNYRYAPLTMAIKAAGASGVPYYQVGWTRDTTSRFARQRFVPGKEGAERFLDKMISGLEKAKKNSGPFGELISALKKGQHNYFVVGPEIMSLSNCRELLDLIRKIADLTGSRLFLPNPYGNLYGLLSMMKLRSLEEINQKIAGGEIDLLYLIGDVPYHEKPPVKHIIYQNAFPAPPKLGPDVILPASLWGETGGSYLHADGMIKRSISAASGHGYAFPHDEILVKISEALGVKDHFSPFEKPAGINIQLPGNGALYKTAHPARPLLSGTGHPYMLIQERDQHTYFSLSLAKGLPAFGELVRPGHVMVHPADAGDLGLKDGDPVILESSDKTKNVKVRTTKNIAKGFLFLINADGEPGFPDNPCPVNIRRENV